MPGSVNDPTSGRVKHSDKITIYLNHDELVAIERARLTLRADHGVNADRGRIVREAVRLALADLAANGQNAGLVEGLR